MPRVELSLGMKGVALLSGVRGRTGIPELAISGVVMPEGLNSGNSNMWSCSKFPGENENVQVSFKDFK